MASSVGSSRSAEGGVDSECEGEDPEDSSSHSDHLLDTSAALENLKLQNEVQKPDPEDELTAFRQQWQRELEATPPPRSNPEPEHIAKPNPPEPLSEEDRAKQLFLCGVEMERGGKLYEAIQHYKRAMQILPDVESRLYNELRAESPEVEVVEEVPIRREESLDSDDEVVEGEDLHTRLQRIMSKKDTFCEPQITTKSTHISWLPYEVIQVILRWVVSAELDHGALERVAAVSRGFYLACREPTLWRALCLKTWGVECGTPRSAGFGSWRDMFARRPRLHLHGCYISKTTYLRHGENSFQDQFYRPWYLVDYYRYLRFFPEGMVLMWTTPDEPAACVGHLKHRLTKPGLGILAGHYRLIADKVVIIIKKTSNEKKPAQASNTRFRSRRKDSHDQHEQTFHMELELKDVRRRRNWQLVWRGYCASARRDQWTQFELSHSKFPPFAFSRVRNYTAESHAPLAQ